MNAKKKVGIIAVVVILAIAFIAVAFLATQKSTNYYTQIDNDWVTEIAPHGAMNYRYTLAAYDENGDEKELTFETSKILYRRCVPVSESGTHSVVSLLGRSAV